MSFSLTREQCVARTKTQTRRLGYDNLEVGDEFLGVEKMQGLKRGEQQVVIFKGQVRRIRREALNRITQEDVDAEGFPGMTPLDFVVKPSSRVTVIDFSYCDNIDPGNTQHHRKVRKSRTNV